jgi:glycosyltransferase involved in cell wall biosynthesis
MMSKKRTPLLLRPQIDLPPAQEKRIPERGWRDLPIVKEVVTAWNDWRDERERPCYSQVGAIQAPAGLHPYPIDMSPLLELTEDHLDHAGVLFYSTSVANAPAIYHPSNIAQFALAHWNAYLAHSEPKHKEVFLRQVSWLLGNEVRLSENTSVWPVPFAVPEYYAPRPWLSSLAQGCTVSALVRAYQLTGSDVFLQTARRAAGAFEHDILDGGVSVPMGEDGIFFEEVAVYPAAHILNGYLLALLGLYDYVEQTHDNRLKALIERSLTTLHALLNDFDSGYWTRYDLYHKRLAPWFYHSLHITLLEVLAKRSGCEHCSTLAARWSGYRRDLLCQIRYLLVSRFSNYYERRLQPWLRRSLFRTRKKLELSSLPLQERICIPGPPLSPTAHEMLTGCVQVMRGYWQVCYLSSKGKKNTPEEQAQENRRAQHTQFPGIWPYCLRGAWELLRTLRRGPDYHLILPQDGLFTAAFAGLIGRLAGVRVIAMEHGDILLLADGEARRALCKSQKALPWQQQFFEQLCYLLYWPSLRFLAKIAIRCCNQFLVASDEAARVYRQHFKITPDRLLPYPYMLDCTRFPVLDKDARLRTRVARGIAKDAIIITMINHSLKEKELRYILQGIALALTHLSPHLRSCVKVLIAGNGLQHTQLEKDIKQHNLDFVCMLWGEAGPKDVPTLLSISDIFLAGSTHCTTYAMGVLEAMAAGCAVVATKVPQTNARLLAEGRGITVKPANATEIGIALAHLCSDLPLCRHMGQKAREYVARHHSAEMLRRSLLRASFFSPTLPT